MSGHRAQKLADGVLGRDNTTASALAAAIVLLLLAALAVAEAPGLGCDRGRPAIELGDADDQSCFA